MLAVESPVVLNTIISYATEYMYHCGHMSAELTMKRNALALRSLRKALITSGTSMSDSSQAHESNAPSSSELSPKQATLAAVLLQIANSCFVGWVGVHSHLACAIHLLWDLDYVRLPVTGFVPRLLLQRFAMLDVNASLIHRRRTHLPPSCWIFIPNNDLDTCEPSFREMTGCPQPVLGFLARVCNLAVDLSERQDEAEVFEKAFSLETDLRLYARSCATTLSTDESLTARHLDTLSQCFYWCTHLVLQRRIYRDSIRSPRVQNTVSILIGLMKSMPVGCGPDSNLSLPLHLTSREVINEEDRAWVKRTNQEMRHIYPNKTRDETMARTEATWRRADARRDIG